MGLGLFESLIIAGLCLIFFGGRRLPALGQAFGKAIVSFKKGFKGEK